MAKRETHPRLQELYDKKIYPYSISKLNAIDGCLLEAYFSYKCTDERRNREKSIYGIMGNQIHEVLEGIYNDISTPEDLLPAMKKELADADLINIDFPRDFKGGTSIRDSWIKDMTHFCNNFKKLEGNKFTTEELIILKVSDKRYLIGYVDLIQLIDEEKKIIDIYDFKTSSIFKKEDLAHHGRQLVVYAMAKEQQGYTVRRVAWLMLKYVKVSFEGYARSNSKTKKTIEKIIQRGKIGKELAGQVERLLVEAGYNEIDIDILLEDFIETNQFDILPKDISSAFKVEQCIVEYDINEEVKQEVLKYINERADIFEELWEKTDEDWLPVKIDQKQSFYCNNLCSHRSICPEIKKYNSLLILDNTNDEDLF